MSQMLQCYKCGTENKLGTRFCTVCGEKFLYTCPQCNATIESGDEYCSHCAARLNWGTASEQITDITSGQAELTNTKPWERKKGEVTENKLSRRKGINPWLIALIITVVLIIAIFVIDKVI